MTARPPRSRRVVVVGGGISGLACAHEVLRAGTPSRPIEVSVFEAAGRVGGKLHTIDLDGMPVEAGADSFVVRKPWAVELCNELGLEDQVVIPGSMGAYVWTARGLVPFPDRAPFGIPGEVGELLRWPGLSRGPKLRALLDLVRPARRGTGDESLGELLRRRFGPGMAGTMVEPLLSGLHAADPLRLSVDATFPELRAWERRHGSLLRGARAAARSQEEEAGRQPLFASVWGGLTHLVDRLVGRIGPDRIRIDHPVSVVSCVGGLSVRSAGADHPADSIVLATPAFESARLLREANPEAAAGLSAIPYVSTGVVLLAYPDGSAAKLPEGSGFVVPPGHWTITACTWLSRKWPHPAYGDRAVVRCFVGRAGQEEELELADDDLIARAADEVGSAVGLKAEPSAARVVRWHRSMPQYEVGHLDLVSEIERSISNTPGVFVTGAGYRGVGIADCVRQGRETARRLVEHLDREERPEGAPQGAQREAISWTS